MSVPRFHAPSISPAAERVTLQEEEANHATRVLRLPEGTTVRVFDGKGREWSGRLELGSKRGQVSVTLEREVVPVPEPIVPVTLGIGVLKGDQMDAVVRDATALGVAAIAPMETVHVTVPPRAWKSGASVERWQRVAVAAAKQCGRAVVPEVRAVAPLSAVLSNRADTTWMCVEPDKIALGIVISEKDNLPGFSALVLVGPEGGWADHEMAMVRDAGGQMLSLGPRRLRAELAPIVALSSLWTKWGW